MFPSMRAFGWGLLLGVAPFTTAAGGTDAQPPPPAALAQRISLHVRGEPLVEVLRRLERDTSVPLRAARHLRERRMTLRVEKEPLRGVLDRIAAVWSLPRYSAKWVTEAGREGLLLTQNPAALREGELREAADRRILGEHLAALMNVEYREKPLDPAAVEGERQRLPPGLKDTDPRLLARPEWLTMDARVGRWDARWGATVGGLLREAPPPLRERALNGEKVVLPSSALSPGLQDLFFLEASSRRRGRRDAETGQVTYETMEERRQRFARESVGFEMDRDTENGTWHLLSGIYDENGNRTGGSGPAGTPIGFSEELEGERGGKGAASQPFPEREKDRTRTPLTAEQRQALVEAGRKGVENVPQVQELLHRVLGRPIVADYYTRPGNEFKNRTRSAYADALKQAETLEGFLDIFCKRVNYRWRRHGQALLFRSRLWWIDDEWEVPLPVLQRLLAARQQRGYLNLEELALAARLTKRQLQTLAAEYLPEETVHGVSTLQPWLGLYGSLGPAPRERLEGPEGLLLGELPPAAQELLLRDGHLGRELRDLPLEQLAATRVRLYQRSELETRDGQPLVETLLSRKAPGGRSLGRGMRQTLPKRPEKKEQPAPPAGGRTR